MDPVRPGGPMPQTTAPERPRAERPGESSSKSSGEELRPDVASQAKSGLLDLLRDKVQHSRAAQATLLATTLLGAAVGLGPVGGPRPEQPTQATRPAATPAVTVALTPARTAPGAAFDPCTLVTTAEAGAILEKPVTAESGPPPSAQCLYQPQSTVVIEFPDVPHGSRPAQIQIQSVVVTVVTGATAATRYDVRQALFGRDPEDKRISGLGDKAIVVQNLLSVLQGSSYLQVGPNGGYDFGREAKYQAVQQKWLAILEAFARPALQRISASAASPAATAQPAPQSQAAQQAQPLGQPQERSASERSAGPNVPGGLIGAIAGLLVGALAILGIAAQQRRTAVPGPGTVLGRIEARIAELRRSGAPPADAAALETISISGAPLADAAALEIISIRDHLIGSAVLGDIYMPLSGGPAELLSGGSLTPENPYVASWDEVSALTQVEQTQLPSNEVFSPQEVNTSADMDIPLPPVPAESFVTREFDLGRDTVSGRQAILRYDSFDTPHRQLTIATEPVAPPIETEVEQPVLPPGEVFSPHEVNTDTDRVLDPGPQHGMLIDGMAALASPPAAEPTTKVEQPTLPDEETFTPKPKGPDLPVM